MKHSRLDTCVAQTVLNKLYFSCENIYYIDTVYILHIECGFCGVRVQKYKECTQYAKVYNRK